jgi:hypothetical protein
MTAFTRIGASSTASARVSDSSAPQALATTVHPAAGRRPAAPVVSARHRVELTAAGRASPLVDAFVRAARRSADHGDAATGPRQRTPSGLGLTTRPHHRSATTTPQ